MSADLFAAVVRVSPFLTLHIVALRVLATVSKGVAGCVDVLEAGIVGRAGT